MIAIADGLTDEEMERAIDAGPEHAPTEEGYPSLLEVAGFEDAELIDVTDEYATTVADWTREWDAEGADLIRLLGVEEFAERQARRRNALTAIEAGLLKRWLISAMA